MIDWTKAPKDAQFYSKGVFCKQYRGDIVEWDEGSWVLPMYCFDPRYEESDDFELRPESEK